MGTKLNKETGFWEAFHSKRHPITRRSYSARRKTCKSEAEAKRVEKQLIVQVEDKLRELITPNWNDMLEKYFISSRERGLMSKTLYASEKTLRAHTYEWNDRLVDTISTQEIRDLLYGKLAEKAESHKKYALKCI